MTPTHHTSTSTVTKMYTPRDKLSRYIIEHCETRNLSVRPVLRTDIVNRKDDRNPFLGHRISSTLSQASTTVYTVGGSLKDLTEEMFYGHSLVLGDVTRIKGIVQEQEPLPMKAVMLKHLRMETYIRTPSTAELPDRSVFDVSHTLCRMLGDPISPGSHQIHPSHARTRPGDVGWHTTPESDRGSIRGCIEQARENAAAFVGRQLLLSHKEVRILVHESILL